MSLTFVKMEASGTCFGPHHAMDTLMEHPAQFLVPVRVLYGKLTLLALFAYGTVKKHATEK